MGSLLIRWERVRRIYSDAVQVSISASEELTDKLRTAPLVYHGEAVLCTALRIYGQAIKELRHTDKTKEAPVHFWTSASLVTQRRLELRTP